MALLKARSQDRSVKRAFRHKNAAPGTDRVRTRIRTSSVPKQWTRTTTRLTTTMRRCADIHVRLPTTTGSATTSKSTVKISTLAKKSEGVRDCAHAVRGLIVSVPRLTSVTAIYKILKRRTIFFDASPTSLRF